MIYIDENFRIRREPLPEKFVDAYNLFRDQIPGILFIWHSWIPYPGIPWKGWNYHWPVQLMYQTARE